MLRFDIPLTDPPDLEVAIIGRHAAGAERYRLNGLACIHLYRYGGELRVGRDRVPVHPGDVSYIPPDTSFSHHWHEEENVHVSLHFRPRGEPTEDAPVVQPLDLEFEGEWARWARVVAGAAEGYARASLWALLWRLAEHAPASRQRHPIVLRAESLIVARLADPISMASLADEVGVSHNHLIRLFHQEHGTTVREYVRRRRMQQARHLLVRTDLPIKAVAARCGFPDAQSFHKAVRRAYGLPPSTLREHG